MDLDERYIAEIVKSLCQYPRTAGSPWNATVRQILVDRYRSLGFDVQVHKAKFVGWELVEWPWAEYLAPIKRPLADCLPVVWSGSTDEPIVGTITRAVEEIPSKLTTFEAYEWNCFPVVDQKGGLKAVLLSNERDDRLVWPQPRDNDLDHLPYLLVATTEGIFIEQCLQANIPVEICLSVASRYLSDQVLSNVIAQQGSEPSIIVGSHYDSFFHTQGAHDNASGTACLLYLARILSALPLPDVRLVSFDAEEWNKLGAYRYVEALTNSGEISRIKRVINIDSVGIGESIYLLTTPDLEQSLTSAVENSGFLIEKTETESGTQLSVEPFNKRPRVTIRVAEKFPQFDSWPFMQKGIAVVQVGTFGEKPFPYWHDPRDIWPLIGSNGYQLIAEVAILVDGLLRNWR